MYKTIAVLLFLAAAASAGYIASPYSYGNYGNYGYSGYGYSPALAVAHAPTFAVAHAPAVAAIPAATSYSNTYRTVNKPIAYAAAPALAYSPAVTVAHAPAVAVAHAPAYYGGLSYGYGYAHRK